MTKAKITDREITDGFGSVWEKCPVRQCGLEVVRPGKVQCWCDGCEMPATDVVTLASAVGVDAPDVAFIVGVAERRLREQQRGDLHSSSSSIASVGRGSTEGPQPDATRRL